MAKGPHMSTAHDMQIIEAMDEIEDLVQKVNATHQGWNESPYYNGYVDGLNKARDIIISHTHMMEHA